MQVHDISISHFAMSAACLKDRTQCNVGLHGGRHQHLQTSCHSARLPLQTLPACCLQHCQSLFAASALWPSALKHQLALPEHEPAALWHQSAGPEHQWLALPEHPSAVTDHHCAVPWCGPAGLEQQLDMSGQATVWLWHLCAAALPLPHSWTRPA